MNAGYTVELTPSLNEFSSIASRKTNDDIRLLLGRILAGEISKPGSFSPGTIHALATLTKATAQKFQRLCEMSTTWPAGFTCIITAPFDDFKIKGLDKLGISYQDFLDLQSRGLLSPALFSNLNLKSYLNRAPINYAGEEVLFSQSTPIPSPKLKEMTISVFSPIGHELRSVIPMTLNQSYNQALLDWLKLSSVSIIKGRRAQ